VFIRQNQDVARVVKKSHNIYWLLVDIIKIILTNSIMSVINTFNGSILQNLSNSNVTAYSQNLLHRSSNYITLFDTAVLPYNKQYNGCSNTLCYTSSKGTFIYKPHTAYGMVGTSAAAYLGRRNRL